MEIHLNFALMKNPPNETLNTYMMKKTLLLIIFIYISIMANAQNRIYLTAGDRTVTATLAENAATRELMVLLQNGPVTVSMSDYGGFEKVGMLPQSFTTSNSQITTVPGDIMLYQGNNMVIFYGSNSWSYTPLGKIDGATAESVRQFLGNGDVSVKLSLESNAGIKDACTDNVQENSVYDLQGRRVGACPLPPGLYIIDGVKTLIK